MTSLSDLATFQLLLDKLPHMMRLAAMTRGYKIIRDFRPDEMRQKSDKWQNFVQGVLGK
jgi:hypothetical protein